MKLLHRITVLLIAVCSFATSSRGQCPYYYNVDFSMGNTTNWNLYTSLVSNAGSPGPGLCCGSGPYLWNFPVAYTPPATLTGLMTSTMTPDPYTGFPVVPPAAPGFPATSYSLRLNGAVAGNAASIAVYTFVPSTCNLKSLGYRIALVFEDYYPHRSFPVQEPEFQLTVTDVTSNTVISCSPITILAGPSSGLLTNIAYAPNLDIQYLNWQPGAIDLSSVPTGHVVSLDFRVGGCTQSGHWGYAYISLAQRPWPAIINACGSVSLPQVPPGFQTYTWSGPSGPLGTGLTPPVVVGTSTPLTYTLVATPYSGFGCAQTFTVTVDGTPPPIYGYQLVCGIGGHTFFGDAVAGGVWSSSATGVATVSPSGMITGISGGTADITYTTLCGFVTRTVTVDPVAPSITGGPITMCIGSTATLSGSPTGGLWSSSAPWVASVSTSGLVTGLSTIGTFITYTLPSGCYTVTPATIGAVITSPITGHYYVCGIGNTLSLSAIPGGGSWISGNPSVATVSSAGMVTGIATGTADITYTTSIGCVATRTVTVDAPSISGTTVICNIGGTTTLSGSPTGGTWSSSSPAAATVSSAGVVTAVAPGITTITYTLATGCYTTTTVGISATIVGDPLICNLVTSTTWYGTPAGGTWASGTPSVATITPAGVVTAVSGGTSLITYTTSAGCVTTKVVSVDAPSIAAPTTFLCGTGASSTWVGTPAGGTWSSSDPAVATVSPLGDVTAVSTGTADITYTTAAGCIVTLTVTVDAPLVTGTLLLCGVGSTYLFTATPTGGTWWSGTPSIATVSGTGLVTAVTTGTVVILYTMPSGCSGTAVLGVEDVTISGSLLLCDIGTTSSLTASPAGGSWVSGTPTVATVSGAGVVTAVAAGTTEITYTTLAGCTTTVVVTVEAPTITGTSLICGLGLTTTLTGSPTGGSWTSSTPSVATVSGGVVTAIGAGTTMISYTTLLGCVATFVVTVDLAPSITGAGLLCGTGSTITLGATPTGGTWSSSTTTVATISTSGVVTAVAAGTSLIDYTTINGCTTTATVTVETPAITGTLLICGLTGSTTLTGSPTGGAWSSGTTSVATITTTGVVTGAGVAGTSRITYTLPSGCAAYTVVTVSPAVPPIMGVYNTCVGLSVPLVDAATGGTWTSNNPSIASIGATGIWWGGTYALVTGVSIGVTTITYTLPSGCYATTAFTVDPAVAPVTGVFTVCSGATSSLADATPGGTWSSSVTSVASVGSGTGVVTGVSVGTSTISYVLPSGCYATHTVSVYGIVTPPSLSLCVGQSMTLSGVPSGGVWTSLSPGVATVTTPGGVVTGAMGGTAVIQYTAGGCTSSVTVSVDPTPTITSPLSLCAGTMSTLSATPGSGIWSGGTTGIATITPSGVVNGIAAGTAPVTYTSPAGCVVTDFVTVNAIPAPAISTLIPPVPDLCLGGTTGISIDPASVSGLPGCTYMWSSSSPGIATVAPATSSAATITAATTGIGGTAVITCVVTSAGCSGSVSFTVTVHAPSTAITSMPVASAGTPPIVVVCTTATLTATTTDPSTGAPDPSTYSWLPVLGLIPTTGSPIVASPPVPTTYTVTGTDAWGCVSTADIEVYPSPCACVTVGYSTLASSYPTGTVLTGNYTMNTNVQIYGNVNFTNAVIFIGSGYHIEVMPGAKLTLTNSHLFCCPPLMWQGIILDAGTAAGGQGQVYLQGNTIIEDAEVAIDVQNAAPVAGYAPTTVAGPDFIIYSSGAIFNKNHIGIRINKFMHPIAPMNSCGVYEDPIALAPCYPFVIENTVFTSRDLSNYNSVAGSTYLSPTGWPWFWPGTYGTSGLMTSWTSAPSPYDPPYNIDHPMACPNGPYPMSMCNDLHRAQIGISLNDVGYTTPTATCWSPPTYSSIVTGSLPTLPNPYVEDMFDNLQFGILALNSNLTTRNSIFMHMTGRTNATAGAGIFANSTPASSSSYPLFKFYLYGTNGTGAAATGCYTYPQAVGSSFYDCNVDVRTNNYFHVKAEFATMSSKNSTSSIPTNLGQFGFLMQSDNYYDVQINYNNIYNISQGIRYTTTAGYTGPSAMYGEVQISANNISASTTGAPTAYGESMNQAISVNGVGIADVSMFCQGSNVNIHGNSINSVFNGIRVTNFNSKQPVVVDANTVSLIQNTTVPAAHQTGISMVNVDPGFVQSNSVGGPGATTPMPPSYISPTLLYNGYTGPIMEGIHIKNMAPSVSCNYVSDLNTGFYLEESQPIQWINNAMYKDAYGMVLLGQIGPQGIGGTDCGDVWLPTTGWWSVAPNFQTYTLGGPATNPALSPLYTGSGDPIYNGTDAVAGAMAYVSGLVPTSPAVPCPPTPIQAPNFQYKQQGQGPLAAAVSQRYTLFPNPSDGTIKLKQDIPDESPVSAEVVNMFGQKMFSGTLTFRGGETSYTVTNSVPGLYLLNLTDSKGQNFTFRFVIQ